MGEHDHCEGHCILQEVWVGVSEEMGKLLAGYTLADLVDRTRIGHPEAVPVENGAATRTRERKPSRATSA